MRPQGDVVPCREILDLLGEYLEGELDDERLRVFEAHLGRCADCESYLETYRRTVALTRAAGRPEPEPDLEEMPEDLVRAILELRPERA